VYPSDIVAITACVAFESLDGVGIHTGTAKMKAPRASTRSGFLHRDLTVRAGERRRLIAVFRTILSIAASILSDNFSAAGTASARDG
jgi:hypothetical protein